MTTPQIKRKQLLECLQRRYNSGAVTFTVSRKEAETIISELLRAELDRLQRE